MRPGFKGTVFDKNENRFQVKVGPNLRSTEDPFSVKVNPDLRLPEDSFSVKVNPNLRSRLPNQTKANPDLRFFDRGTTIRSRLDSIGIRRGRAQRYRGSNLSVTTPCLILGGLTATPLAGTRGRQGH